VSSKLQAAGYTDHHHQHRPKDGECHAHDVRRASGLICV
jgi:hypothetical protein